jgi:hypothetical protein
MSDTKQPRIPVPPSREDLDQISREQAMIADEWAPNGQLSGADLRCNTEQETEMDSKLEGRIKERAYDLWQKEGSPEGRDQEFWERARLMLEAEQAPAMKTPLSQRSAQEHQEDQAVLESFPASDPPAFTPTAGTRTS